MARDSCSVFRQGISRFITATKNVTERVGEKNKRTIWTWVSSKRKKGSFCATILCSFLCSCRLSWAYIFRETSTKATKNANSSLTVFPHCLVLLTVFHRDCYFTPTGLFCSPLSTALSGFHCQLPSCPFWDLSLLVNFWSHGRSRAQALCLGFAPKQRYRLPGTHTHIVSY